MKLPFLSDAVTFVAVMTLCVSAVASAFASTERDETQLIALCPGAMVRHLPGMQCNALGIANFDATGATSTGVPDSNPLF